MCSLLEKLISASECYGLLYDKHSPACKSCEAWQACEKATAETLANEPDTPPAWATSSSDYSSGGADAVCNPGK